MERSPIIERIDKDNEIGAIIETTSKRMIVGLARSIPQL